LKLLRELGFNEFYYFGEFSENKQKIARDQISKFRTFSRKKRTFNNKRKKVFKFKTSNKIKNLRVSYIKNVPFVVVPFFSTILPRERFLFSTVGEKRKKSI